MDSISNAEPRTKGAIQIVPGMKNVSNKSIFQWDTGRHKPASPVKVPTFQVSIDNHGHVDADSPSSPLYDPASRLPYQVDCPQAGAPSYTKRNLNDNPTYIWSDIRKAHNGTSAPFGLDTQSSASSAGGNGTPSKDSSTRGSQQQSGRSGQVQSLSEIMKNKKSEPKSLASLMQQQR